MLHKKYITYLIFTYISTFILISDDVAFNFGHKQFISYVYYFVYLFFNTKFIVPLIIYFKIFFYFIYTKETNRRKQIYRDCNTNVGGSQPTSNTATILDISWKVLQRYLKGKQLCFCWTTHIFPNIIFLPKFLLFQNVF